LPPSEDWTNSKRKDNLRSSQWGKRYVICYSPDRAEEEKREPLRLLGKLLKNLKLSGSKGLVGNRGFRRYLKRASGVFEIDWEKVRRGARYDGKYLLMTNNRDMLPRDDIEGPSFLPFKVLGMKPPRRWWRSHPRCSDIWRASVSYSIQNQGLNKFQLSNLRLRIGQERDND